MPAAWVWVAGACGVLLIAARLFPALIYDAVIVRMTAKWYAAVLGDLPNGTRLVDIGIGTATALLRNKDLITTKSLQVVGVDYDAPYVAQARANVTAAALDDRVVVLCKSLYDPEVPTMLRSQLSPTERPFDAAYFSGSFTLMPDPVVALKIAAALVKPGGVVYITQTFQKHSGGEVLGLKYLKPALKYVTTIDFGRLTYEEDALRSIGEAGFKVLRNEIIPGSIDHRFQVARMLVVQV